MRSSHVLVLASLVCASAALHCGSSPTPCYQDAVCLAAAIDGGLLGPDGLAPGRDGGPGGDADSGPVVEPPPGCKPELDVKDSDGCVVDEFGVFVDAQNGKDDTGKGTKAEPFKSIGVALTKLNGRPRVYICEGTYAERVQIASTVSLHGGFACKEWKYSGQKPKLAPTEPGYALQISGATGATYSDLDIAVQDAKAAGESSIAVFIASSTATFTRTLVSAGTGAAGHTPSRAVQAAKAQKGGSGMGSAAGAGGSSACPDGTSTGGKGARATFSDSTAGLPDLGKGQRGLSGNGSCAQGLGGEGEKGKPGNAAPATTDLGSLSSQGWAPASGASGGPGTLGQGGGGGGSSDEAAGGGGGAGGCGGAGGEGGGGGGASIAILAFSTKLMVREGGLTTRDAGAGGGGALGQLGQGPGGGGDQASGPTFSGCAGGPGGPGGDGASGAGGAGGVSAGVVFKGQAPEIDTATIVTVGKAGAVAPTNPGPPGRSEATFEAK